MKEEDKVNEEKIQRFFEDKVNQSGHSLEGSVERILKKNNFSVFREEPYLDKDLSIGRTIDLVARAFIPDETQFSDKTRHALGQLALVVECKNLPDHGWVFFGGEPDPLPIPETISLFPAIKPDPANAFVPTSILKELFYASSYQEIIDDSGAAKHTRRSNKNEKNLYESVLAVTKATRYEIDSETSLFAKLLAFMPPRKLSSRIVFFVLFQSLIVFRGHMYGAKEVEGKTKLEPIRYAQIPKKYVSQHYDENLGEIHIVSYDWLEEYLQLLRSHYWSKSASIIQNQNSLLEALDRLG